MPNSKGQGGPNWMPGVSKENYAEDPRWQKMQVWNQKQKEMAKRRKEYTQQLNEFKHDQLSTVTDQLAEGRVSSPADMLMKMIQEQELLMADPNLDEKNKFKEKELYLKLWDRYASLTGANAPSASSISVESTDTAEETPEDIDAALAEFTGTVVPMKKAEG